MDEKFVDEKCPDIRDILGFLKLPELTESEHKKDKEIPLDSIDTDPTRSEARFGENDLKLLIEKTPTKEETPLSTQVYPSELSTKEPNSSSEETPSELTTELSKETPLELSNSSELTTELSNSELSNSSELTTELSNSELSNSSPSESSNSSSEETSSTTEPNSSKETSSENYSSDGSDTVEIPVKEYHENIDLDDGALGDLTKQLMDLRINYEEEKNNQHGGMFLKPIYKLSKSKSRKSRNSKSRNSKSRNSKSRKSKSKSRK